jgi:hypothetical protein
VGVRDVRQVLFVNESSGNVNVYAEKRSCMNIIAKNRLTILPVISYSTAIGFSLPMKNCERIGQ